MEIEQRNPHLSSRSGRIHLTNVTGLGACQLLHSLLPALENDTHTTIEQIYLPDRGTLSTYQSANPSTITSIYHRRLPNTLSRMLECTMLAGRFSGDAPLLVLGDLPLRCRGFQAVFVQTPHLLRPDKFKLSISGLKYWISRSLFRMNMDRVCAFIVQTNVMREALEKSYPGIVGKVHVIPQPVPSWLLNSGLHRMGRVLPKSEKLTLIYPAAGYPHKNHALLSRLDSRSNWPVEELLLTLDGERHPAQQLSWVNCCGFLTPRSMVEAYSRVDALLFLSLKESYGFPLVEAMFVGLPIVCPDLPYARTLCGDQAIYFQPGDPQSLLNALTCLKSKLDCGWWPDWQDRMASIPANWDAVASRLLDICHR